MKSPWHITHPILAEKVAGGGVFVSYPKVSAAEAEIDLKCEVANVSGQAEKLVLRYTLNEVNGLWGKGKPGKRVAEGSLEVALGANEEKDVKASIRVVSPRLWSPDAPHLYDLRLEVLRAGLVADIEKHLI